MPDNPTTVETFPLPLPDHRILALTGKDALAFAQAQFMNDVTALTDGQWQWNGWLTPKGRLIALFALLRLDAETLWLLLPDYPPAELADGLKKYVFRSKLVLTPRDDLHASGTWDAASVPDLREFQQHGDDRVSLSWPGGRRIDISPVPAADAPAEDAAMRWRGTDLSIGIPRLDATQSAQWTPQQLSLDRLRGYSVKKGCYPGQEIIARTHFLGQAKRGLVLLDTANEAKPGVDVAQGDRAIGQVIASAARLAQAVMPLVPADGELMIGGHPATRREFAPP